MKIEFEGKVANTVLGATKIDDQIKEKVLTNDEDFSKIKSQDLVPMCVKLAVIVRNLMNIDRHKDVDKRKKIAEDALLFVKPAQSLGFVDLAKDLKQASIYVLKHGKIAGYTFGNYTKV